MTEYCVASKRTTDTLTTYLSALLGGFLTDKDRQIMSDWALSVRLVVLGWVAAVRSALIYLSCYDPDAVPIYTRAVPHHCACEECALNEPVDVLDPANLETYWHVCCLELRLARRDYPYEVGVLFVEKDESVQMVRLTEDYQPASMQEVHAWLDHQLMESAARLAAEQPPISQKEPPACPDLDVLSYRDLQKLAKHRGVKASGTRRQLLIRVKASYSA